MSTVGFVGADSDELVQVLCLMGLSENGPSS